MYLVWPGVSRECPTALQVELTSSPRSLRPWLSVTGPQTTRWNRVWDIDPTSLRKAIICVIDVVFFSLPPLNDRQASVSGGGETEAKLNFLVASDSSVPIFRSFRGPKARLTGFYSVFLTSSRAQEEVLTAILFIYMLANVYQALYIFLFFSFFLCFKKKKKKLISIDDRPRAAPLPVMLSSSTGGAAEGAR